MVNHWHIIDNHQTTTISNLRTTRAVFQMIFFYNYLIDIVSKTVMTSKNFPLRIEHVRRMFEVADLRERVILSMATDLGLRISDFIKIKKADIPPLDQEPPVMFDVMTGKEEVIAHGFLSGETVELLKVYLPTLKKDNPFLFPSNGKRPISDEWLNRLLKKLAVKAQIELNGKSLTFHCFRKMFLSASIDSGIGLTAGKKLCGKAIPKSDNTYLTTVQLRKKFMQLKKFLTIKQIVKPENHGKIEALKIVVTTLQEDLTQQRIISQTVTEENINIKKDLGDLKERLDTITRSRKESDEVMNRLFEDPAFQQMIRVKIRELRL